MSPATKKKKAEAEELEQEVDQELEQQEQEQAPTPKDEEPQKNIRELTRQQKAAAVIVSLGTDKASKIYKYMESEDVEHLTMEVAKLGFVDADTSEEALKEYYQLCMTSKAVTEGGMEYARAVLEKAYGPQAAEMMLDKLTKTMKTREFDFLSKADGKSLFNALQQERPQTIALVLSYVDPDKAAMVIEGLDKARQVQVVQSIASMDSASPAAVKVVQDEISKRFESLFDSKAVEIGGIDHVASIMNNVDRTNEKSIFERLSKKDEALVDEIRKRMFTFEDIFDMDDRSVQRFIRDCDPRDLVLSIKGAPKEVAEKLFANMSTRMAETMRDDLEVTTNVRMRDVEEAQQRVVSIIRSLEERNELIILKGGRDDIIA